MPELNIEEKIQEALKKKSFKDNKFEYLGIAVVFCLMLYITFVVAYFVPILAIFIFLLVDIPFLMGFKHFIWFGPASGSTLIEGFKISMICGYLNFISYIKIFFATNIKAILGFIIAFFASTFVGGFVIEGIMGSDITNLINSLGDSYTYQDLTNKLFENEKLMNAFYLLEIISLVVAMVTFFIVKLTRALLPYTSFLRLSNLDGRPMDNIIAINKKMVALKKKKYYLNAFLYHLLYLIPIALTVLVYWLLKMNPVYSATTRDLISTLTFFITMAPAVLGIELNYRNYCVEVNQEIVKEHKRMLNDAINDVDKKQ